MWKSQLQTCVALSTLEAEYQLLSDCLRSVIHVRALVIEVTEAVGVLSAVVATINATVFEDNNGALQLATSQRITSRTKYFHVKWHHFWSHVRAGTIVILKIESAAQEADYLTKGLSREIFEKIRKLVQGW
jgi:hypothetical protein